MMASHIRSLTNELCLLVGVLACTLFLCLDVFKDRTVESIEVHDDYNVN